MCVHYVDAQCFFLIDACILFDVNQICHPVQYNTGAVIEKYLPRNIATLITIFIRNILQIDYFSTKFLLVSSLYRIKKKRIKRFHFLNIFIQSHNVHALHYTYKMI